MKINELNPMTPSFGHLNISNEASTVIRKLPLEHIEKVKKATAILSNTEHYHVEVNNDMEVKLTSDKNPYFGIFKTNEYNTDFFRETRNGKSYKLKNNILIKNNKGQIFRIERILDNKTKKPEYKITDLHGAFPNITKILDIANLAKTLDDIAIKFEKGLL
jgi:hypothetical protein